MLDVLHTCNYDWRITYPIIYLELCVDNTIPLPNDICTILLEIEAFSNKRLTCLINEKY